MAVLQHSSTSTFAIVEPLVACVHMQLWSITNQLLEHVAAVTNCWVINVELLDVHQFVSHMQLSKASWNVAFWARDVHRFAFIAAVRECIMSTRRASHQRTPRNLISYCIKQFTMCVCFAFIFWKMVSNTRRRQDWIYNPCDGKRFS